jgi:hypothetical protein
VDFCEERAGIDYMSFAHKKEPKNVLLRKINDCKKCILNATNNMEMWLNYGACRFLPLVLIAM